MVETKKKDGHELECEGKMSKRNEGGWGVRKHHWEIAETLKGNVDFQKGKDVQNRLVY